jgi:hypothetical protein
MIWIEKKYIKIMSPLAGLVLSKDGIVKIMSPLTGFGFVKV